MRSATHVRVTGNDDLGVGIIAEVVRQFIELGTFLGLDGKTVIGEIDRFALEGFVVGVVRIA